MGKVEARMEEFSFPSIAKDGHGSSSVYSLPFPHFAAASSIWFVSSSAEGSEGCGQQLKQSEGEDDGRISAADAEEEEEERMDMLWEDLNEELRKKGGPAGGGEKPDGEDGGSMPAEDPGPSGAAEYCCVLKAGHMLQHRRPSFVMFLKVLKKLLLVQRGDRTNAALRF